MQVHSPARLARLSPALAISARLEQALLGLPRVGWAGVAQLTSVCFSWAVCLGPALLGFGLCATPCFLKAKQGRFLDFSRQPQKRAQKVGKR